MVNFIIQPGPGLMKINDMKLNKLNIYLIKRRYHNLQITSKINAFQSAAPHLWNALPSTVRNIKTLDTFKTAIKTHFFNLAFK